MSCCARINNYRSCYALSRNVARQNWDYFLKSLEVLQQRDRDLLQKFQPCVKVVIWHRAAPCLVSLNLEETRPLSIDKGEEREPLNPRILGDFDSSSPQNWGLGGLVKCHLILSKHPLSSDRTVAEAALAKSPRHRLWLVASNTLPVHDRKRKHFYWGRRSYWVIMAIMSRD